jgi:hypothetical protein
MMDYTFSMGILTVIVRGHDQALSHHLTITDLCQKIAAAYKAYKADPFYNPLGPSS